VIAGGASVVYATDHEAHSGGTWRPGRAEGSYEEADLLHAGDARHAAFLRDADGNKIEAATFPPAPGKE